MAVHHLDLVNIRARRRRSSPASTATRWRSRAAPAGARHPALGSFIAGTFALIALLLIAPSLATSAIAFGPAEYSA